MGKLRLTGSLEVYNLENVSVEDAKEKVPDTLYNRAKKAIMECYDNGYEILEHQSGDILPEVLNECYNRYDKKLADAFEKYLAEKIHRGDFMLEGDIEFGQMDENFGSTSIGYADIYVDTNIDIEKELEVYKGTDKVKKDVTQSRVNIQEFKDYIINTTEEINKEPDVNKRKEMTLALENKIAEAIDNEGDIITYENGAVYNCYINWDSNNGFSFITASENIEDLYEYLPEDKSNLQMSDIINALAEDGERRETWEDLILSTEDLGYNPNTEGMEITVYNRDGYSKSFDEERLESIDDIYYMFESGKHIADKIASLIEGQENNAKALEQIQQKVNELQKENDEIER